jgi:hypothetical protein
MGHLQQDMQVANFWYLVSLTQYKFLSHACHLLPFGLYTSQPLSLPKRRSSLISENMM